jgi:hypothetical protein
MKPIISLALILAGSAAIPVCLSAQAPGSAFIGPPAPAALSAGGVGPKIQFNTENYAAGTNLAGDPIRFTFVVTNTGDETLVLSNVKPSCGCTTVGETTSGSTTTWTHEIAPGQTGVIPIQIITSNLRGQINKTIAVVSNDRTRPSVTLQVNGVVWLPIEVAPAMASFNLMPDATNANTQVLKIFNRMDTPLSLSDPQSSTNAFSAVLKTNVPGQEFDLVISAAPPSRLPSSLNMTVIQGEIRLKCSATNRNPLAVTVFETISPEITVFPPNIQLPPGPLVQPITSTVSIRDNIGNLALSDPAVNVPGVSVSMRVLQTNRSYVLSVVFPLGFEAPRGQSVLLTVKTDNPRFPALNVPFTPVPGMAQPIRPAITVPPVPISLPPPAARAGLAVPPIAAAAPPSPPLR